MSGDSKQINKSAIRNFAIEARNILMKSAVTEAGFYGVTRDEIKSPVQKGRDFEVYETLAGTEKRIFDSDIKRRAALVEAVHQKGFDEVIEETAYTWFNRLIAIRFMEVNNYLPFRMRVLSSDSGSLTPDIVSRSLEVDLHLTDRELESIQKAKDDNQYDEAFRILFIKTCNELNDILPGLFEKTDDYMELLLKLPYTSDGVVRMLVDTIPESNFNINEGGQVEIIGWLYQYYNTEPKAKAFAKKGKITKEEIPAVTQLFTPDWIVRYMVENSLGRLWAEHLLANGDSRSEQEIANDFGWKYYLPEAEQEPEVHAQLVKIRADRKSLNPEDILCIDPCMGSGHILVYLYDVLMQIYREDGYSERDAARSILEHNLYGLDIDDRAYQLSYFAVLMKARQYDRMILKKHVQPKVYSIQESNTVNRDQLKYFGADMSEIERNNAINQLTGLLDTFIDAKEYGSILNVDHYDWDLLRRFVKNDRVEGQYAFDAIGIDQNQKQIQKLIEIGETMTQKYHVVSTNPPYMGSSSMNPILQNYIKKYYEPAKADLFAVMLFRAGALLRLNGYGAFISQHVWMFLSRFEDYRRIFMQNDIVNMAHLGPRAFDEIAGEVVQTTTFIMRKSEVMRYNAVYLRLIKYDGEAKKEKAFLLHDAVYIKNKQTFSVIPGNPLAYWASDSLMKGFSGKKLGDISIIRQGLATGDNDEFLRLWFEPETQKVALGYKSLAEFRESEKKYIPLTKGGSYRKWYGNNDYVIAFDKPNYDKLMNSGNHLPSRDLYFRDGITWSNIAVNETGFRKFPNGYAFSNKGAAIFSDDKKLEKLLIGFLNSVVTRELLVLISPSIGFEPGYIASLSLLDIDEDKQKELHVLVDECIYISKRDWDDRETSWDFLRNPIVSAAGQRLAEVYEEYKQECEERIETVKKAEERINSLFIQIYGLEDELSPNVLKQSITLYVPTTEKIIKELISYAVGCMFGRYSLDIEGLAYAGGDWNEAYNTKYKTFLPDEDAIIPITDEEYFKDDIVARFVEFVRVVYGDETLEENLTFIADALGNKGDTPRAVIRNYFLNDFYKDHCNTYSVTGSGKRPIYWLFDSGKQNGFKALIYIHRYTPDTVGLIRSVYLHNAQAAIQNSLQNTEYIISTTTSATERAQQTRKRDKYVKQLNELRPYYQALSHIALQRIPMDLDEGVKKNYQMFQGVEISTEGSKKKQTIDLLAKL